MGGCAKHLALSQALQSCGDRECTIDRQASAAAAAGQRGKMPGFGKPWGAQAREPRCRASNMALSFRFVDGPRAQTSALIERCRNTYLDSSSKHKSMNAGPSRSLICSQQHIFKTMVPALANCWLRNIGAPAGAAAFRRGGQSVSAPAHVQSLGEGERLAA